MNAREHEHTLGHVRVNEADRIRGILANTLDRDPGLAFCGLGLLTAEAILLVLVTILKPGSTELLLMVVGMVALPILVVGVGAYTIHTRSKVLERPGAASTVGTSDLADDPHLADEIPSDQPIIEVEFEKVEGRLRNPRVTRISNNGKKFFGYAETAAKDKLIDKDANKLMGELENLVSPPVPHWLDLGKDQQRVYDLLFEGKMAYALVPVRFNKKHPYFPNQTFLPLIVENGELRRGSRTVEFRKALYLDVTTIPRHLFSQHAWHEVSRKLTPADMQSLADQLTKVREAWLGGDQAEKLSFQCEHIEAAEKVLRNGGGAEVINHCSETGWFSLWEMVTALNLGKARQFLLDVVGSFEQVKTS